MALSVTTKPEQFCLNITKSLDQVTSAPINVMEATNILDVVMSSENKVGWNEINRVSFPGKKAPGGSSASKITVEYEKPYCRGGSSGDTSVCDATGSTTEEMGWLEVDIDQVGERHFTVTKEEFAAFCNAPNDRVMSQLKRKAFQIKQEINDNLIIALYGANNPYFGGISSVGATTKTINILNPDGNIVNTQYAKIKQEYRKANYSGKLYTFGGETLANYIVVKGLQGLSQNSVGANVDPLMNMPFIYDVAFDTNLQTLESDENSHGITVPQGGFQIQEWFDHEGYGVESLETVIRNKMTIDGVTYDYSMVYDPCGGSEKTGIWKIQLKKRYGFGFIPASAYCDGQGLNFHWIFGCGDQTCI